MGRKRARKRQYFYFFFAVIAAGIVLIGGCATFDRTGGQQPARTDLGDAENALAGEDYAGALKAYKKIFEKTPQTADESLFYIGVIYASPKYDGRDYRKAMNALQKLTRNFPQSQYRAEAERMIALLKEILTRDKELIGKDKQIKLLKKQIEEMEVRSERMKEIDLDVENKRRKALE